MAHSVALIFLKNIIFPKGEFNSHIKKNISQKQQKLWRVKCKNMFQKTKTYKQDINREKLYVYYIKLHFYSHWIHLLQFMIDYNIINF